MKCPNCGVEIENAEKFCTLCGCNIKNTPPKQITKYCGKCGGQLETQSKVCLKCVSGVQNAEERHTVEKPRIQPQQVKSPPVKSKNIGCLASFVTTAIIVTIVIIITVVSVKVANNNEGNGDNRSSNVGSSNIAKAMNLKDEEVQSVSSVLNACGIKNVNSIEHDESLDDAYSLGEKGYRISAEGVSNIIMYASDTAEVYYVKYAGSYLYADGRLKQKINDFIFTDEEETALQIRSTELIKSVLVSPSTAQFPNILKWKFGKIKDEDKIIVQSYVDSQNGFGATIRSEFQVTYTFDARTLKSIIIDGEEYFK